MSDDNALTPSEEAYFSSGGESDPEVVVAEPAEPASEPVAEAVPAASEPAAESKPEKTVPLAALHQARQENKEMRARVERMEQTFAELQRRAQQQAQPEVPDKDVDPVGYFLHENEQLRQRLDQVAQSQTQWEQQQQREAQNQQFFNNVRNIEQQFQAATPDYEQASKYLRDAVYQDFINRGADQNEAQHAMTNQMITMVSQAMQMGVNPAMLGYQMAQARGWKSPQAAAPVIPAQTNTEKISQINKGQAAAKSLSATGGKAKAELTLESLAEMDDDDFEANWSQLSKLM